MRERDTELGIVYIATNIAFPANWIKIGMTNNSVDQRMKELSASTSVPTPFTCYYAAEVQDALYVERQLHQVFAEKRINPKKEFFELEPFVAKAALSIGAIREIKQGPPDLFETEDNISSAFVGHVWDTFNIPIGAELVYARDNKIKAKVIGVKKLEFDGEIYSLKGLSDKLIQESGSKTTTVVGAREWLYEGEMLDARRSKD